MSIWRPFDIEEKMNQGSCQHITEMTTVLEPSSVYPHTNMSFRSNSSASTYENYDKSLYSDQEKKRVPRPFTAVAACIAASDPDPSYAAFREVMLEAMRARNGGSLVTSNPRMRREVRRVNPYAEEQQYQVKRARNNAAAKKSRDLRKIKEDELAIRAAFLEHENAKLMQEIAAATQLRSCHVCWTSY